MKKNILYAGILLGFFACGNGGENTDAKTDETNADSTNNATALIEKSKGIFGELPKQAVNPENEITEAKVILGKTLYYDNRLSKDQTQSCNTCHNLETYGVDNNSFSLGDDTKTFGGRNSPTVLNAALHVAQFWDGREPDVEAQAGGPILNPAEMNIPSEQFLIDRLTKVEEYTPLFADAFPGEETPLTYDNIKKAIGAFERTLITPSRFDDFLNGDATALNEQEQKGLETYISVGCITCHSGNNLGGTMFQKFGLFADYAPLTNSKKIDFGKFDLTQNEADKFIFKVPSLRNIEKTNPYFHDGSVADLKEAVQIMAKTELNKELSEEELGDIVAYLNSLTSDFTMSNN